MTPSNPDNQQPLIYRIADALGVFHLVAPVNHTHAQSEVAGLEAALAALSAKNSIDQIDENDEQEAHLRARAEDDDVYFQFRLKNGDVTKTVLLTMAKMVNFERALNAPDSTPTANSDNLVTSGGVAAALATKANKDDVEFKVFEKNAASDKINLSTDFAQGQKRATYLIFNYTSDTCTLSDLFTYQSGEIGTAIVLPATEQPAIHVDEAVVVSVLKYSNVSAINYVIVPEGYY